MTPAGSRRRDAICLTLGALLLVALIVVVEETPVADWIVAPLVVADQPGKADAIVVLGAGIVGPCEPNESAFRRVVLGVRRLRAGDGPFLLFTGGTGGPGCRVAASMAALAGEMGVPADRIRVEAASRNTYENGELAAALLKPLGVRSVLIVSDRLHMRRASGVFRRLGFAVRTASVPIYESHPDNRSMLAGGLREYLALAVYRWRGRLGGDAPSEVPVVSQAPFPRLTGDGPIVLLGASYAAGWTLGPLGGVEVVNRGVAGEQSFEMLARFERDVASAHPRAVILWGFINDIFRAPDGGVESALQRARDSYTRMIAEARRRGITPILATEVTARPPSRSWTDRVATLVGTLRGKTSYQDRVNADVQRMNVWLRDTAAREQLAVLELQTVLAEPGGRRHPLYALPDGSHITPAGYDALTAYARPLLEEALGVR